MLVVIAVVMIGFVSVVSAWGPNSPLTDAGIQDGFAAVDAAGNTYIVIYHESNGTILGAMSYSSTGPAFSPYLNPGELSLDITADPNRANFISWTKNPASSGTWSVNLATLKLQFTP